MIWGFGRKTKQFVRLMAGQRPDAAAEVHGSKNHADLHGDVTFYAVANGTLVVAEFLGLPSAKGDCNDRILGFHIHEGNLCSGNAQDAFADTGGHFNPGGCPHPQHAGDMPPLFSNNGYAWQAFFTSRFIPEEIIGRTVVVHDMPDDFKSQPSGDAGQKIACGLIRKK